MWVALLFLALALYLLWKTMVIMPPRKAGVLESLGHFRRVLLPGVHFIMPWESLRRVNWSYPDQRGGVVRISGAQISFDVCQMDLPPAVVMTKDQIRVTVDPTLFYSITDFSKAAYESEDILNLFAQIANQSLRQVASDFTAQALRDQESLFTPRIQEHINYAVTSKGIQCSRVVIQQLKAETKLIEATENLYVTQKTEDAAHLLAVARKKHEQDLALQDQEHRKRMQEAELELKRREHEVNVQLRANEITALQTAGFTPEQIVELERAKNLRYAFVPALPPLK